MSLNKRILELIQVKTAGNKAKFAGMIDKFIAVLRALQDGIGQMSGARVDELQRKIEGVTLPSIVKHLTAMRIYSSSPLYTKK